VYRYLGRRDDAGSLIEPDKNTKGLAEPDKENPAGEFSSTQQRKEVETMSEPSKLDKTFHFIMKRMVGTGQAPHYTEIAAELGVSPEEGRKTLHELFFPGFPGWLHPSTDYITSFPPFNNLPTHYRITIEGEQKWFAQ
jgi:hypothetical protein